MRSNWWKILSIVLLIYAIIGGLLFEVPRLHIVNETIRSLYFHVPMWFGMVFLFLASMIYAIRYLSNPNFKDDTYSVEFANVGLIYGILGIITGMIWANYTWGSPWHGDPKQNGAAIALLVYLAYFILRGSVNSEEQRARLSAVYNIFAFVAMIPLIFIIPRMTSSMHPGSGGNPGFNMYDLDSKMRMVFYPAVIGWILLGTWISTLRIRMRLVEEKIIESEDEKSN
ncbi:MAG TPA: cytochrome c biogenesis protein CcsA [Cyclobacteriaceae bacterium]|jgi:heme exporter protein C|nr:cytochrome c biogenesis protein CcsA [Cyclobacteriaceae bacterium]